MCDTTSKANQLFNPGQLISNLKDSIEKRLTPPAPPPAVVAPPPPPTPGPRAPRAPSAPQTQGGTYEAPTGHGANRRVGAGAGGGLTSRRRNPLQ